ncbi:MAG: transposase family protein [Planctomycetes bacterium]|nr:transposase family protein [Planctomycetota bacterium]
MHWAKDRGYTKCETAAAMGVHSRTLFHWQRQRNAPVKPRGRKVRRGTVDQRNRFLATLAELGPHVGLSAVRACHPEVSRAEARNLQRRYRRYWRRKHECWIDRLTWTTPGSVWAMDFTKPKFPIDGVYRRVLVVLDLSSGCILLAQPCEGERAEVALEALSRLFELHDAPLVLKSDNGSAFIEACVQGLLAAKNVQHLFSPPRCPRYNGSCERGIGELKSRAKYQAELNLRPHAWSSSDLQRAQSIGNEILRPWGHTRPTRIEVWNSRQAIPDEQRTRLCELRDRCRENRLAELREAKLGPNRTVADEVRDQAITLEAAFRPGAGGRSTPAPGSGQSVLETLSKHELASLERTALADALEQLGFLSYWRRQFTPPIKLKFRAKN